MIVIDSSVVVAALLERGHHGEWAEAALLRSKAAAPALMPFEASNAIRRMTISGAVEPAAATTALTRLIRLKVALVPFEFTAERSWELRDTVTMYDGAFVAAAELMNADLYTLDRRLANAPGPRCTIRVPDL